MRIHSAEFVTSAARLRDLPDDGTPQIALVGRSNVGKSSLINALVRRRIARTSAAPGKTRLANIYRVRLGGGPPPPGSDAARSVRVLYFVDLPGYGYARGGAASRQAFETLTADYFGSRAAAGAILAVDARHPGLPSDLAAGAWLADRGVPFIVAVTKVDTLAPGRRGPACRIVETSLAARVWPVSAVTGEGLKELWQPIVRLSRGQSPDPPTRPPSSSRP